MGLEVIEGTGEELQLYLKRSPKQRFRLVPLSVEEARDSGESETHGRGSAPVIGPNDGMIAVMREIAEHQKSRP